MDPTKPLNISSQQHHGSDTPKHEKFKLVQINSYLTCHLCKGYLIDATTISECLHSFCRSCIIKFLQENCYCPVCEVIINKAKPCLKLDKTLQDIVYKLVPQLFTNEMQRRKQFYHFRPELARKVSPEERGEDTERTIFNPQDAISLSIEYVSDDSTPGAIPSLPLLSSTNNNTKNNNNNNNNVRLNDVKEEKNNKNLSSLNLNNNNNNDCENVNNNNNHSDNPMKRYLQCPGMCRIEVLKKFVRNKYNVDTNLFHIDILYKRVPLPDHYTLIDIGYIYSWKRNEPMKFFFRITDINKVSERFDYFDSSSYYRNNNENNTKTTATMSPLSNAISSNDHHHHKETTMSALKQYNHQSTTKQMKNRKPSQKQQQQAAAIVAAKNKEKNNVIKSSTPPPSMPSSATTTINNVKKTSESDDKKLTTTITNNSVKEISNVGGDNKKKVMMLIKEKQKKIDSVINTNANKNSVNEVIVRKMEKLSTSSAASSMLKQSDNKINGENRLIIDNNRQNDKKVQNKCSDGVLWPQSLKIERKTDEKLIPSSASVNKQLQTSTTPTLATKMSLVKKPNNLSKTIESVVSNQENGKSALKFKTSELKNENDDDDLDPKSKFFKSIELTAKSSIVTPEKKKMGGETLKNLKLPPTVMTNQQQQQGEKRKSEVMFLKRADGEQTNKKLKLSSLNGATTPINKKPMRIIVRSKDNLKSASCSEKQSTVRQIMLNLNQNVSNVSKIVVDSSASPPNGIVAPPLATSTPTPSNKTPPPPPPSTNDLQSLIDNCKINIPSSLSITLNEGGGEGCGPQPPSIPPVKNFIEILKLPENASTTTTDKMQVSPNGVKPQSFQKIFEESVKKSATPTTTSETKTNANNKRSILEIALKLQKKTKIAEKQKNKDDKKDKTTKEVQNKTVSPKTSDLEELGKQTANLHSTSLGLNYTVSVNKSPETSCAQPPTITTTTTNFKTINNNQVNKKQQISPTLSSSSAVSTPKLSPSMKKQSPEAVNSQLLLEKYNIQNLAQLSASFPSALAAAAAAAASSSPSSTNHLNAIQHAMFLKHIEHQNWLNHQSSLRQYEKYLQNLNASSSNTAQNAIISTSTANIIKDN